MTYATTYHIGNDKRSRKRTAAEVVSTVGQICRLDTNSKRRCRNKKGQAQSRSHNPAANGFLKTTFLPKMEMKPLMIQAMGEQVAERDYLKSLSEMAGHYGIGLLDVKDYAYPYSLALARWDMESKLKKKVKDWDNIRFVKEGTKHYCISEECYQTGATVFYIPIMPLFLMLHDKKMKQSAQLLLSVCCYLYRHAQIPFYSQQDSYLYWQYETMKDWVDMGENEEVTEQYRSEIRQAEWIGERMLAKISHAENLKVFKKRLDSFKCLDQLDEDCKRLALETYALWQQFPNEHIFRNAKRFLLPQNDDGVVESEMLCMDKYISFYADNMGWLCDSLMEGINCEFNEYSEMEMPCIIKHFDGREQKDNSLDFENNVFHIIELLCGVLHNIKRTGND